MQTLGDYFERPRLRDGVTFTVKGTSASLSYLEQGCEVEVEEGGATLLRRILEMLHVGATTKELLRACPRLEEQIPSFLHELDKLGLLTDDSTRAEFPGRAGRDFHAELRRFAERFRGQVATSQFYSALRDGLATWNQIVGYAIEYFHIVHRSVGLISPILAHPASRESRLLLHEFVRSEFGHDQLLVNALAAVDLEADRVERMAPLPPTLALCATLGVLASQDPLSFKCCVFLFEEANRPFHDALVKRCKSLGMPPSFYGPFLSHATLNDEGDHGDLTRALLRDVAYVSPEEEVVAKKHVASVVETIVWLEAAVMREYGREPLSLREFQ